MFFILLIALSNSILNKNKYLDLILEAQKGIYKKLSLQEQNEEKIYLPGLYSIKNFKLKINAPIIKKGSYGIKGLAINKTEKIAVIICQANENKTNFFNIKNAIISLDDYFPFIKLRKKISEQNDVFIYSFDDVSPFDIFSNFHFSNYNDSLEYSFSDIYEPLQSYQGNEIYNEYALNKNCGFCLDTSCICKNFTCNNWPSISQNTDVSCQNPFEKEIIFYENQSSKNVTSSAFIGGVFGQFAGLNINFENLEKWNINLFHACEAETHVKLELPAGTYLNQSITSGIKINNIFFNEFKIFNKTYSINVDGVSSVNVYNLTYKSEKEFEFNQRAGFKAQKDFQVYEGESYPTSDVVNYELLRKDISQTGKQFYAEYLNLHIVIFSGLNVHLKAKEGNEETQFDIKCGIQYKREIISEHNSAICSCPYLLGRNTDMANFTLKIFLCQNLEKICSKKLFDKEQFWIRKQSNPWCLGGNLFSYDDNFINGYINSAVIIIKSVKYLTDYYKKPYSIYRMKIELFDDDYFKPIEEYDMPKFQFSGKSDYELDLNYFKFVYDLKWNAKLSCIDSKNVIYTNNNLLLLDTYYNGKIELVSKKGTPISANIIIAPSILCDFGIETTIEDSCRFALVEPNLAYCESIGLIIHRFGSPYKCHVTNINDEYSKTNSYDCIYDIKNIWKFEIKSNIYFDFNEISILVEIKDGITNDKLYEKTFNKQNLLESISKTFEIPNQASSIKMKFVIDNIYNEKQFSLDKRIASNYSFKADNKYEIQMIFNPINYPVTFEINSLTPSSSMIFAPAYKCKPFSQSIQNGKPSTIEKTITQSDYKYGIFKLEFEFNVQYLNQIEITNIKALLIMKNIIPICDNKKIDDDTYLFTIPKDQINTEYSNDKNISYYPIPFRRNKNASSIQIIDIFLPPNNDNERCDSDSQKFYNSYSFIHNACIANIRDGKMINNAFAYCDDCNIPINQYYYIPKKNMQFKWKLFGFAIEDHNEDTYLKNHTVVLRQNEIYFPVDESSFNLINKNHFPVGKNQLTIICQRCKEIKVICNRVEPKSLITTENDRFTLNISQNQGYLFWAICKNNNDKNCFKELTGLNENMISLLAIPINANIKDEFYYNNKNDIDYKNDILYSLNIKSFLYSINTRSKIHKMFTFDAPMDIKIFTRNIGSNLRISAYVYQKNKYIPILFNSNYESLLADLRIDQNYAYECIGGSIFLPNNIFISTKSFYIDRQKGKYLFYFNDNMLTKINSIHVNLSSNQKKLIDENKFCFVQSNENICDYNYIPLRYPEFNHLYKFNYTKKEIEIIVRENIKFFYLPLHKISENIVPLTIHFKCSKPTDISGEIFIPSGVNVSFEGNFNLSDLYITTKVNWQSYTVGFISFQNVKIFPKIDVEIEKYPVSPNSFLEHNYIAITSENVSLNLLNEYDSQYEYEFSIKDNAICCSFISDSFMKKNDFCVYNTNRSLCKPFGNSMDSISVNDLNDFSSYFQGLIDSQVNLHFVENATLSNNTLHSFIENNQNISLHLTSNDNNVYLNGKLKFKNHANIIFDTNDKLYIDNLTIESDFSIINELQNKDVGIIDLAQKKIKEVIIYLKDIPQVNFIDNYEEILLIKNCNQELNIRFNNTTFLQNFLNISVEQKINYKNCYLCVSTMIIYKETNRFCIYETEKCNINNTIPANIKNIKELIDHFENYRYHNVTLIITQDINANLDFSYLSYLKFIEIQSNNDNPACLAGLIKIYEGTNATLMNLNIMKLEINVDINVADYLYSYFDITRCIGMPVIKIFSHAIPQNIDGLTINKGIGVLKAINTSNFELQSIKYPINGGYLIQSTEKVVENDFQTIYVNFSYQQIEIKPNNPNHFCIYEKDDQSCLSNVNKLTFSDFCSLNSTFLKVEEEYIFKINENISFTKQCNMKFDIQESNKFYKMLLIGDLFLKGKIKITGNVNITILNSKIINQLDIVLDAIIPQNYISEKIIIPSIVTYENSNPKSLTIEVPNYSNAIELYHYENKDFHLESRQFLRGICNKTNMIIPIPFTRDFRIKSIYSNSNGIFGMKINCFIQKYKENQLCFYNNSPLKCMYNENLENYLPLKYSDIPPSFSRGCDNPRIYFFDTPNEPFNLSFQIASLYGYDTAKIVNDNASAELNIFVPYGFHLYTNGDFKHSTFYIQYKYDKNNMIDYGSLHYTNESIIIEPISSDIESFPYDKKILLSSKDSDFSYKLGQNIFKKSIIKQINKEINIKTETITYDLFNSSIEEKIYDLNFMHQSFIVQLLSSYTINLFAICPKFLAIQSNKNYVLTFNMSNQMNYDVYMNELIINDAKIDFTNYNDIDFKDFHITFINCKLQNKNIGQIKGNYVQYDRYSYLSFFDDQNKIFANNGDNIRITQSSYELQNEIYTFKSNTFIYLNLYNSFTDLCGKNTKFIGTESVLSINSIMDKSYLSFYNFTKLILISEKLNGNISLINVSKLIIQVANENNPIYIKDMRINENNDVDLKSNAKLIIKRMVLTHNYSAKSEFQINKLEISPNNYSNNQCIKVENLNISDSIEINNNLDTIFKSCKSLNAINININTTNLNDISITLSENNNISINSLKVFFLISNEKLKSYLIKGINEKDCTYLTNNIQIYNNTQKEDNKKYDFKCENFINSTKILSISLKKSDIHIDHLIIIIIASVICALIIIILIIIIIIIIKVKKISNPFKTKVKHIRTDAIDNPMNVPLL